MLIWETNWFMQLCMHKRWRKRSPRRNSDANHFPISHWTLIDFDKDFPKRINNKFLKIRSLSLEKKRLRLKPHVEQRNGNVLKRRRPPLGCKIENEIKLKLVMKMLLNLDLFIIISVIQRPQYFFVTCKQTSQIGKHLKMTTIYFLKKFLEIKLLCLRESQLFCDRLPAPTASFIEHLFWRNKRFQLSFCRETSFTWILT